MKKIPTLFIRKFHNGNVIELTHQVTPGCEDVLKGKCIPTVKWDGACCAIINGVFYKRYDAKRGKTPPDGAIACCNPDPVTGHWPHWVPVNTQDPADRWFWKAYQNTIRPTDGTYEAIGPHFRANPHGLNHDVLRKHGTDSFVMSRKKPTWESLKKDLEDNEIEGIVFWKNGEPLCKIRRKDFGQEWPIKDD